MSELSPEARELLRAGRDVLRPTEADRARSLASLGAELGDAALHDGAGSTSAATSGSGASAAVLAAGAVVAAALIAWLALRNPESAPNAGTNPPPKPSTAVRAVPSELPPVPAPPARDTAVTPSTPPSKRSATPPDHLAEEVAILARAATFLNTGRSGEALRELEDHRQRFPNGLLTEERRGARARALCALGRRDEAQAELARMAQKSARSPHLLRARRFCGLDQEP